MKPIELGKGNLGDYLGRPVLWTRMSSDHIPREAAVGFVERGVNNSLWIFGLRLIRMPEGYAGDFPTHQIFGVKYLLRTSSQIPIDLLDNEHFRLRDRYKMYEFPLDAEGREVIDKLKGGLEDIVITN